MKEIIKEFRTSLNMDGRVFLGVLIYFTLIDGSFCELGPEPKRCCSPSQWEADAYKVHFGSSHEFQDYKVS